MKFTIDTDVIKESMSTAKLRSGANKAGNHVVNNWEDYLLAVTALLLGSQVAENADDIEELTEDYPHR